MREQEKAIALDGKTPFRFIAYIAAVRYLPKGCFEKKIHGVLATDTYGQLTAACGINSAATDQAAVR